MTSFMLHVPGAHFSNDFSITIQMQGDIQFLVILIQIKLSLQDFTNVMTFMHLICDIIL